MWSRAGERGSAWAEGNSQLPASGGCCLLGWTDAWQCPHCIRLNSPWHLPELYLCGPESAGHHGNRSFLFTTSSSLFSPSPSSHFSLFPVLTPTPSPPSIFILHLLSLIYLSHLSWFLCLFLLVLFCVALLATFNVSCGNKVETNIHLDICTYPPTHAVIPELFFQVSATQTVIRKRIKSGGNAF